MRHLEFLTRKKESKQQSENEIYNIEDMEGTDRKGFLKIENPPETIKKIIKIK